MKTILTVIVLMFLFLSCTKTPVSDLPYDHTYYELTDNVYYIECENTEFARSYQFFVDENPELAKRIISVFSDGDGDSGRDCGYFIILK